MDCTVYLWDYNKEGLVNSINPDTLAKSSTFWEQDVIAYGPWRKITGHKIADKIGGRIRRALKSTGDLSVLICGSCTSSMDVAWHLISKGLLDPWDSVLTVEQSTGRGQYNRNWRSLPGNIYASWRWPHPSVLNKTDQKWYGLISLLAGYILAEILDKEGIPVQLKWPNDLLLNDRKVGGILIENRSGSVLVGIGLNVAISPEKEYLAGELSSPATNLKREGFKATPLDLWCRIVGAGKSHFYRLIRSAPGDFLNILERRIAWKGREVLVELSPGEILFSTISGLCEDGGLILKTGGKRKIIYSGRILLM